MTFEHDRDNDAVSRRLRRTLYGLFAGLLFAVVLIGWWVYGDGTYAGLVFAVCAFLAGTFGFFLALLASAETRRRNRPAGGLRARLRGYLPTQAGRMPTRHAVAEMLLPPLAMALAFIGLSLVFAVVVPD